METMTSTGLPASPNEKTNSHSGDRTSVSQFLHSLIFVLPIAPLAVIYFRLRDLPAETLGHLGFGLIVVAGALTGLGTFLWCVHWGVSRDGEKGRNIDPRPTSGASEIVADHTGEMGEAKQSIQTLGR